MSSEAPAVLATTPRPEPWIRFDRNELAGSFGDIGTDLPLILGMILTAGLDSASVFIMFGLMQVVSGLLYGLPMPMQPLKAMAVLVISQKLSSGVLYGAGLAIGVMMLSLTLTGMLQWLTRVIPRCVVRGMQLGLGLSLASLALHRYVPAMGAAGYVLAGISLMLVAMLWGNRRVPAALLILGGGVIYAMFTQMDLPTIARGVGLAVPQWHSPSLADMWIGLILLALPQLPLSLSNSIVATHQTIVDLFPHRGVQVRHVGLTYSLANLITPWLGGVPVCHGCGGLVGHYAFGARTGGSVILYGGLYLAIGLLFSRVFNEVVAAFPLPMLGTVLLVEAIALMLLMRDTARDSRAEGVIALIVGVMAWKLPQGYLLGSLAGCAMFYALGWWRQRGAT